MRTDLEKHGFTTRPADILLAAQLSQATGGVNAAIVRGAPGTGKTFFAETLAKCLGAQYMYLLSHNWLSEEELFFGVNIGAVAAGVKEAAEAYQPGFLALAAEASQMGRVVLCLDELDKAPQKVENLLLDFLQTGRVYGPNGKRWQASLTNLVVIITSNEVRPLGEPLQRRCYRHEMAFLPAGVERDLLRKWTGSQPGLIRLVVDMATAIRTRGESAPSLQEMRSLCQALRLANSADDAAILVRGWLCKTEGDWGVLTQTLRHVGATVWGEVRRDKR